MFVVDSMTFRENGDVFKVWKRGTEGEAGLLINPVSGFLMQYIGEYDKMGAEIYVDDIIKYHNPNYTDRFTEYDVYLKVVRGGGQFIPTNDEYNQDTWYKWDGVEVIGNAYQNPKLMESEYKS